MDLFKVAHKRRIEYMNHCCFNISQYQNMLQMEAMKLSQSALRFMLYAYSKGAALSTALGGTARNYYKLHGSTNDEY
jgi:hypothetical protein